MHDPNSNNSMIKYGFFAGLALATICLVFTITYISLYSHSLEQSFEAHVPAYLSADSVDNLTSIVLARTALNKTLLQSCGVVSGIAFGFVGFSLFLLGIKGNSDAEGTVGGHTVSFKRLAPGSLIILSAILLIGVSANHKIDLDLSPAGSSTGGSTPKPTADSTVAPGVSPSKVWTPTVSQP